MSSRHKPAKVKLEDAVKSCRAVVAEILAVKLAPAHPLAILHREDCAKLVKTIKRVQPFLEDLEDNRPPEPAEAEGVKALQELEAALRRSLVFVTEYSCIKGPMFALLNSYDVACEALNCYLDLAAAVERIDPHALLITDQASIEARALFLQQLQRSRLTLPAEAELLVSDLHAEVENVRTGRSDGSLLQHVLTEKVLAGSSKEQLGYDAVYLAAMSEAAEEQRNHVQQMFYDILSRAVAELMPTGGEIVLVPEYAAHVGVNRPPAPPAATAAAGAPVGTPPKSSAATTAAAGPAKSASPAPAAVSAAPVVKAAAAAPGAPVSSPAPAPAPAPAAAAVVAAATGAVPGAPQAGLAAKYTMAAPPPPSAPPAPPVIVPDFIAIVTDPKATVEAKMAAVAAAAEGLLTAAPPPPVPKGAALVPPPLTQAQQTVLDAFSVADNVRNVMRVVNSDADLAVRQMLLGTLVHAARMDPDIPAALVSCPEALSAAVCRLNLPTDKHVIRKGCLDLLAAVAAAANGAPAAIVSCDAVPALVSLVAAVVVEKVAAGGAPATLSPAAKTPVKTQAGRAAAADAAAASLSPAGRRTVVRAAAPTERSAITPAERHEYQEPALGLLLLLAGAGQVPALQQAGGLVAASLVLADATASGKAHVAAAQLLKALLTDVFASVAAVKAGALAGLAARSASKEAEEAAAVHTALGAVLQPPSLPPGSRLSVAHAEIGKAVRGCGPLMQLLADVPAGPLQDLLLQLLVHAVGLPENRRSVCEHEQGLGVLLGVAAVQTEALSEPGPPVAVLLRLLESEELKVPLAKGLLLAYEAASANAAAGPKAAAQYALVIAACAAASSEGVTGVPQLPGGGASKAQAKCAADFCGELVQLRCLSKFTALLKSPVLHSKLCGLLLYAALLRYGPAAVRADAVSSVAPDLLDCAKLDAAVAEHLPMTAAARRGLTALADGGKVSEQLLVPLVGFLKAGSPGIAASCCAAISAILTGGPQTASAVAHHLKVLAAADLHTALVALLKKAAGGDASHRAHEAAYMSLLALLARSSADGADRVAALGGVPLVAGVLAASGDEASRLQCCSALGAVARRGGAAAEEVAKAVSVTRMLEVARGVKDPDAAGGAWDDVVAALAALATFHDASRVDLFRSLRAFLLRGNPRDLTLCALLCSSLAPSPKPRELIVVEGMLPGLVAVSRTGVPRARAAAADALTHLAMAPGPVMVTGVDGKQSKVDVARSLLDHKAPQALVEMLSATVAAPPAAASSTLAGPSASSSSSSAAPGAVKAAVLDESLLLEALEGIAAMAAHPGCKEALKACGGSDKVKELVAKGKRRELGERVAKAAADALIKLLY